ncbi:unnamed protein product [Dicrocoelium dendriticum]|nr:unnamed protein product [Dicrocoelium dendriticum]
MACPSRKHMKKLEAPRTSILPSSWVIAAEGEQAAARSLKKAARVISTSPLAFQLRYLQTLCAISAEKNSTILFPVPIDMMQNLGHFTAGLTSGKYAPWIKSAQDITAERGTVFTASVKSLPKQDDQRESWAQDDADTHSDTV